MADEQSHNERARLQELYAGITDGELEKVALDAQSLTPVAQEALAAELARRKIPQPEPETVTFTEPELQKMAVLRRFRDLTEALIAKGYIESAGIEAFLYDENMVRMDWYMSNWFGGIKLAVKEEDAEAAEALLEAPIPEQFDVVGVGQYQQPKCPKCDSPNIAFEDLNRPLALTGLAFSIPVAVRSKIWKCDSCGHEWRGTERD